MLAVLTMTPRSPSTGSLPSIAAAARRSTLNEPTRLMSMTVLNVSSESGPPRPMTRPGVATPAQLTAMRSSPRAVARSIAACTWDSSRTSAATKTALPSRRPLSSSTSAGAAEASRSMMTTVAPSATRRRAVAPPRPEPPPVMTATVDEFSCMASLSGIGGSAGEELARDDEPLDLVGALEDLGHLRLAHVALERKVLGVAGAAEHLDGVGGHLHGRVGGDELGDGGLLAEAAAGVLEAGRVEVGGTGRGDRGLHVGDEEGESLEVGDASAELLALGRVVGGGVEGGLGQAGGGSGDAEASRVEGRQSHLHAVALAADQPRAVDGYAVEHDLGDGVEVQAHLALGLGEGQACCVTGDDEGRQALAAVVGRAGEGRVVVGVPGVRDPRLGALE